MRTVNINMEIFDPGERVPLNFMYEGLTARDDDGKEIVQISPTIAADLIISVHGKTCARVSVKEVLRAIAVEFEIPDLLDAIER